MFRYLQVLGSILENDLSEPENALHEVPTYSDIIELLKSHGLFHIVPEFNAYMVLAVDIKP